MSGAREARSLRLNYNWTYGGKFEDGIGPRIRKPYQERMLEGGPMLDFGQHQIDLARWWLDSEFWLPLQSWLRWYLTPNADGPAEAGPV